MLRSQRVKSVWLWDSKHTRVQAPPQFGYRRQGSASPALCLGQDMIGLRRTPGISPKSEVIEWSLKGH